MKDIKCTTYVYYGLINNKHIYRNILTKNYLFIDANDVKLKEFIFNNNIIDLHKKTTENDFEDIRVKYYRLKKIINKTY